jgi:hypothetical protein
VPEFGTSGLRSWLGTSPRFWWRATYATFLGVVGRNLRDSSPRIRDLVVAAAAVLGLRVIDCGVLDATTDGGGQRVTVTRLQFRN